LGKSNIVFVTQRATVAKKKERSNWKKRKPFGARLKGAFVHKRGKRAVGTKEIW